MSYPNDRTNPAGAIPVYYGVAPPGGKAVPIVIIAGPGSPISGPIPVRIVAAPPVGPPFPNDQGNDASAQPVYQSAAPNAMPVWVV